MSYGTPYIDEPELTRKGGKGKEMPNTNKNVEAPKASRKYAKTRGEHYKDIVIAILVTGIIAFGLGVKVQAQRNADMQSAVKAAQAVATPEVKK